MAEDLKPVIILASIFRDEEYSRTVIPYIKTDFFDGIEEKLVVKSFVDYMTQHDKIPSFEEVKLIVSDAINEGVAELAITVLNGLAEFDCTPYSREFLIDMTEKYFQEKAVENAIVDGFDILKGRKKGDRSSIPGIMQDALSITFDCKLGRDYFEDAYSRFERYHSKEHKIPLNVGMWDKATRGGIEAGTLNAIVSGTNVGKSLVMVSLAAKYLLQGKKVLYFTMEMSEEQIEERIDANLFEIATHEIGELSEKDFFAKLKEKYIHADNGKLITKQYPTSSANVLHLEHFMRELEIKKKFIPDIVFVDYLGIMVPARKNDNSMYSSLKYVAEEVRGLAVKTKIPFISALQFNRGGNDNTNPDITNMAESMGPGFAVDFLVALVVPEEPAMKDNRYYYIILKNRYGKKWYCQNGFLGVDYDRQTLYDLELTPDEMEIKTEQAIKSTSDRMKRKYTKK